MKILKLPAVVDRTGLSRSAIRRREKDGSFPARREIGPGSVGWVEEEIDEWVRSLPERKD